MVDKALYEAARAAEFYMQSAEEDFTNCGYDVVGDIEELFNGIFDMMDARGGMSDNFIAGLLSWAMGFNDFLSQVSSGKEGI